MPNIPILPFASIEMGRFGVIMISRLVRIVARVAVRLREDWRSAELARFPLTLGLVLAFLTWMVWRFTEAPCWDGYMLPRQCLSAEAFINLKVWQAMLVSGSIGAGATGVYEYVMLTRERKAREAAERRAEEKEREADEERRKANEEREKRIAVEDELIATKRELAAAQRDNIARDGQERAQRG